ncbi:MAG: hypothetical protein ACJ77N_09985 [Chloroflexota bacterium]
MSDAGPGRRNKSVGVCFWDRIMVGQLRGFDRRVVVRAEPAPRSLRLNAPLAISALLDQAIRLAAVVLREQWMLEQ